MNSWFRANAQEAEVERFLGEKVWKCIIDMQFGRRGRVFTRVVAICDESGEPCSTPTEQHQPGEDTSLGAECEESICCCGAS